MLYAALESYVYLPSTLKESSKDTYRRHTIEDMRDAFKGIDNPQTSIVFCADFFKMRIFFKHWENTKEKKTFCADFKKWKLFCANF